jgi:hypothetical protein
MSDPPRVAMTDPARAAMTNPVRVVTIGQLRVVMTDQPRVGTIATYKVGGGMDGRLRAGRTARRQTSGSPRCGMTRVTAVPRVARARKRVAPAGTTEALPIADPAATTGIRLSALLVGTTEDPLTADRVVTIGPRLGVMTGPDRVVTIGPGPGGTTALGRAGTTGLARDVTTGPGRDVTTALGRAGTTGLARDVTTGPGRRVRLGVGGGRIAARVVAIVLRERSGSTGPAGMRTRPARAVTIRRSPQVSPVPSSTVRSRRSCARCRGASLTWSRSTWSPLVG